jgi:hypothetical protein
VLHDNGEMRRLRVGKFDRLVPEMRLLSSAQCDADAVELVKCFCWRANAQQQQSCALVSVIGVCRAGPIALRYGRLPIRVH